MNKYLLFARAAHDIEGYDDQFIGQYISLQQAKRVFKTYTGFISDPWVGEILSIDDGSLIAKGLAEHDTVRWNA